MEMEIFKGADFDEDQVEMLLKICSFLKGDFFKGADVLCKFANYELKYSGLLLPDQCLLL